MLAFFKKQPIDWHFFVKLLRITFKVIDIVFFFKKKKEKKGILEMIFYRTSFKSEDFVICISNIANTSEWKWHVCNFDCAKLLYCLHEICSWILKANFSKVSLYGTKYLSQQQNPLFPISSSRSFECQNSKGL